MFEEGLWVNLNLIKLYNCIFEHMKRRDDDPIVFIKEI